MALAINSLVQNNNYKFQNKNAKSQLFFAGQIKEKLQGLEGKQVLETFEKEIVPIFRATDHTEKIREHLIQELKKLKTPDGNPEFKVEELKYTDEEGREKANIVATRNNVNPEKGDAVILQAHMDMVWVNERKNKEDKQIRIDKNFVRDGKNYWKADDTSLGADNGFGLALGLVVARSKNFKNVPLQLIFTDDEETTCAGASNVPASAIAAPDKNSNAAKHGKKASFINIDAEFFGRVIAGCCGMEIYEIGKKTELPVNVPVQTIGQVKEQNGSGENYLDLTLSLSNAKGGHARDVDKGGINTITEVLTAINNLPEGLKKDVHINTVGGSGENDKFNAIPKQTFVKMYIRESKLQEVRQSLSEALESLVEAKKADGGDPDLKFDIVRGKNSPDSNDTVLIDTEFQKRLLKVFGGGTVDADEIRSTLSKDLKTDKTQFRFLSGLQRMHDDPKDPCYGDIVTSQNMGLLHLTANSKEINLSLGVGLRSSDAADLKSFNTDTKAALLYLMDDKVKQGKYDYSPPWCDVNEPLANLALAEYTKMQKELGIEKPEQKDNHGCLESAIFAEKLKEAGKAANVIAAGPNICDPHTTDERIEVKTVDGFCKFFSSLLDKLSPKLENQ